MAGAARARERATLDADLVVGIDSSTTATKAVAWDRHGRAHADGRAPIGIANPLPGYFEQNPEDWWRSSVAALRAVTARVDPARIAALAISNQRETFGLFDEDGTAVRPAIVWLDERARAQQKRFGESFGAARVHAISGKPHDIIPPLYRMIWHREVEPALFARAARIAEVHAYLTFRLTGLWATSTASADPMGVLDMRAMDWSDDILAAAGVARARMPDIVRPGTPTGEVREAVARETGLRPGTPVIAGGGDGQCAGTGTGVLEPGRAYINLGTAIVSGSFGEAYAHDLAFRTESAVAETGYVFETCLRAGTFLVDWIQREMFGLDPARAADNLAMLEREAAGRPIGSGGVVLVPYLQGCMTPHWDGDARGVLAGVSGSTRRGDIYRAMLEGIALEQAATTDRVVAATGQAIDFYVAGGGGASSEIWLQILADATGRVVKRSSTLEASSLGAAMAAAKGSGWFPTIADASRAMAGETTARFEPDPARARRYAELLGVYVDLWPTLSAWNRRLSAFAEADHG